jgi:hypothetical protein
MCLTALPALGLAVTVVLTGCSEDTGEPSTEPTDRGTSVVTPSVSGTPTPGPSSTEPITDSPLLTVTISDNEVLPKAEEIELGVGEPLLIEIESDRAGELHIHSSPAQFIEFSAGTAQTKLFINTPGRVEVEDHETSAVVALLTVR